MRKFIALYRHIIIGSKRTILISIMTQNYKKKMYQKNYCNEKFTTNYSALHS